MMRNDREMLEELETIIEGKFEYSGESKEIVEIIDDLEF